MHKFTTFFLTCLIFLACKAHGRQQTLLAHMRDSPSLDSHGSLDLFSCGRFQPPTEIHLKSREVSDNRILVPMKVLSSLLFAFSSAAFNLSGSRVCPFMGKPACQMWMDLHAVTSNSVFTEEHKGKACLVRNITAISRALSPCCQSPTVEVAQDTDAVPKGSVSKSEAKVDPYAKTQLDRFFFDRAELFVRSGAGGEGAVGFRGEHPAGGWGGNGGNVYIQCTDTLNSLSHLGGSAHVHAGRGTDAFRRQKGTFGKDAVVYVPPNTLIHERDTNLLLGKLTEPGERLLVAEGGEGGPGNGLVIKDRFKTRPPGGTQRKWLTLSMTLVADVGLLGLPNAGKSTLLRTVSNARPDVADYPFTTLIPNLGVCVMERFDLPHKSMVWLDIPGVIAGAADGKGLGLAFLRHADKCRLMLHLVDGTAKDPVASLHAINTELQNYSPQLAKIPQVVLLTKTDLPEVMETAESKVAALKAAARHSRVLPISSHAKHNMQELLKRMRGLLDQVEKKEMRHTDAGHPTAL